MGVLKQSPSVKDTAVSLCLHLARSLKPHAVRTAEALIDIHKCTDSNIYDCTLRKNTTNQSRLNSSRHLWCSHVEANFQLYLQTQSMEYTHEGMCRSDSVSTVPNNLLDSYQHR